MPIRPGNTTISINSINYFVDDIRWSFSTQEFERLEFDHQRLQQARLAANGAVAQIVQMLGGVPAEVVISTAVYPGYVPRPLIPNSYPTTWQNIKQSINIVTYTISCKDPSNANPSGAVDSLESLAIDGRKRIRAFNTRLGVIGGDISYEQLQSFQADNIQTIYWDTGIPMSGPDISISNALVTAFSTSTDFAVPDGAGGFEIYRNFDITVEQRTVETAFVS